MKEGGRNDDFSAKLVLLKVPKHLAGEPFRVSPNSDIEKFFA